MTVQDLTNSYKMIQYYAKPFKRSCRAIQDKISRIDPMQDKTRVHRTRPYKTQEHPKPSRTIHNYTYIVIYT